MSTIDDALEALAGTGPEFGGGLSNHGPMAAEALITLGRAELVIPWVEQYKVQLDEAPTGRRPIARDEWREALGDQSRVGDWIAFFDAELGERPWQSVLDEWSLELAPGLVAAGTHGLIRTAHAVRSLDASETPARRHELAQGLGFWAARYVCLPERRGSAGTLKPSQAIRRVERVPPEEQVGLGLITDQLRPLDHSDTFPAIADLVTATASDPTFLSDLTETFTRVYLANVEETGRVIGFIHSVTGPSAVRLIAPHVSEGAAAALRRYAWQAAAALYAAMGCRGPSGDAFEPPTATAEELTDAAAATLDPHAIKFTEACLREYALNPTPVYLAAAADATERIAPTD
jgi:Questin oxidase-like